MIVQIFWLKSFCSCFLVFLFQTDIPACQHRHTVFGGRRHQHQIFGSAWQVDSVTWDSNLCLSEIAGIDSKCVLIVLLNIDYPSKFYISLGLKYAYHRYFVCIPKNKKEFLKSYLDIFHETTYFMVRTFIQYIWIFVKTTSWWNMMGIIVLWLWLCWIR